MQRHDAERSRILSSALSLYLYVCFLICGYSNYINKPKINFADSEKDLNLNLGKWSLSLICSGNQGRHVHYHVSYVSMPQAKNIEICFAFHK